MGQVINMGPKWCMNYDSGDYEWIDESGSCTPVQIAEQHFDKKVHPRK